MMASAMSDAADLGDFDLPVDEPLRLPRLPQANLLRRVAWVESVDVQPLGINPTAGTYNIIAKGRANNRGWKAARLVALTPQEPGMDQSYDLEFVAIPPIGPILLPATMTLEASHLISGQASANTKQVRVHAASNSLSAELGQSATAPSAGGRLGPCSADPAWVGKKLIRAGQPSSGNPANEVKEADIAGSKRIIGPGTFVTMDFRPERANVYVDKNDMITRVTCG